MTTPKIQIETLTEDERRWLESDPEFQKWDVRRKVLRIIDAQAADIEASKDFAAETGIEIGALKAEIKALRAVLARWSNFDFDCPEEEYDEESDCYEADGSALAKLYDDTTKLLVKGGGA